MDKPRCPHKRVSQKKWVRRSVLDTDKSRWDNHGFLRWYYNKPNSVFNWDYGLKCKTSCKMHFVTFFVSRAMGRTMLHIFSDLSKTATPQGFCYLDIFSSGRMRDIGLHLHTVSRNHVCLIYFSVFKLLLCTCFFMEHTTLYNCYYYCILTTTI